MTLLLLVTANFFILIVCLIGVQTCYFRKNQKWFWLMLVCALLSGACASVELYNFLLPPAPGDSSIMVRSAPSPL